MANLNCRRCRGWKQCILSSPVLFDVDDHFNFAEIRWCPFQIIFLLSNRETLKSGEWPPEFKESAPTGRTRAEAKFVMPVLVIAEVEARLQQTGVRGEMLLAQIHDGRTFHTITNGAREALFYIKGWRRKKISFARWLREVFHKEKTPPAFTEGRSK